MVVDASVGIKWIVLEKDSHYAELYLHDHLIKKEEIIVPDIFYYEIANTLLTKFSIPANKGLALLRKIYQVNLILYHPTQDDIENTFRFSRNFKTSFYDMLYAVVAKKHKTILITADERFFKLTKFPQVKLLSSRKTEFH